MINEYKYDYTDFSESALMTRGDYLVNVVDKLPDKATMHDIAELPKGAIVVPWGPGSGKSSAIRQRLVYANLGWFVYATYTVEEVMKFYYDVIAHITYLDHHPELGFTTRGRNSVCYFTSNHPLDESILQSTPIVICTHERLLIEPPKILYRINTNLEFRDNVNYRDTVYIDEMSCGYKEYRVPQSTAFIISTLYKEYQDHYIKSTNSTVDNFNAEIFYNIYHMLKNRQSLKSIQMTDTEYNLIVGSLETILSPNVKSTKMTNVSEDAVFKKSFFMTTVFNKVMDQLNNGTYDSMKPINSVYYTLLDVAQYVKNVVVFDGTGDISMRGSSSWTIVDNKFPRSLILNKYPKVIPNTSLIRYNKTDDSSESIQNIISAVKSIIQTHNKLLIYTWKSIEITKCYSEAGEDDTVDIIYEYHNLPNLIREGLTENENRKVEIIYYQSGQDKATSMYADCDAIFIIGKFFIVNHALKRLNDTRNTRITSKDYMLSLIIQAIARTQMRLGKPIDIYLNSNFNNVDSLAIVGSYPKIKIGDEVRESKIYDRSGIYMDDPELNHIISIIKDYICKEDNQSKLRSDNGLILTSSEISELTGVRSDNLKRYSNPEDYSMPGLSITISDSKPKKYIFKLDTTDHILEELGRLLGI